MRVNLHDYSGHPFQVQLSRALAARGHQVLHQYSAQYITGHGRLEVGPNDPATLRVRPIVADVPFIKYSPVGRMRFELAYARAWQFELEKEDFDVVISCNVPLFAMARMRSYFERRTQPWIFWHQDVYSLAIAAEAERKLPRPLARIVGRRAERMERALVASASSVVAIGEPFLRQYERWGLRDVGAHVIANWAPVEDLAPGQRDNSWARAQSLPAEPVRLLYAGTLGRKHNPVLLLDLLDAVKARGTDAVLIVVSEGIGADDIAEAAGSRQDVKIFGYQPADQLSEVLASADVMVALLEPDASQFSVPSKVLSYLCAGRPIIALLPHGNPAAADVVEAGGFVGQPTRAGAHLAAEWLAATVGDPTRLIAIGVQARNLAIRRFCIDRIASRFEQILAESTSHESGRSPATQAASVGEGKAGPNS